MWKARSHQPDHQQAGVAGCNLAVLRGAIGAHGQQALSTCAMSVSMYRAMTFVASEHAVGVSKTFKRAGVLVKVWFYYAELKKPAEAP